MQILIETIMICLGLDENDSCLLATTRDLIAIAKPRELILAHAIEPAPGPAALADKLRQMRPSKAEARHQIQQTLADDLPEDVPVRIEVMEGKRVPALLELAVRENVDLILVRQPPDSTEEQLVHEPIAKRLAMKSPCSLLAVLCQAHLTLNRILVPGRDSECSQRALQSAIDFAAAARNNAEVIALNVFPVPTGYARVGLTYADFAGALREEAEKELDALLARVDTRDVAVRRLIVDDPQEQPTRRIMAAIDDEKVDCVFIGSRGRTGPAGIILGHVTEALIAASPVSVLAVKQKGETIGLLKAIGIAI